MTRFLSILRIALPLLCAVALAVAIGAAGRFRAERDAARAERDAARADTRAFVEQARAATEAAHRADLQNTNRVRAEQDAISKKVVTDYEMELAAVRARVERLRKDTAAGADRGAGAAVSAPGPPAGTAGTPAGEGGLPPLSDEDALIATEQALQLDALIDWVEQQAAVEPSR